MSRYRAHQILLGLVWSSLTGTQQASENFLLISLFALQSYGRGSNRIFQYISSLDQNKLVYIFRSLNVPVPMNIFLLLLEKESRSICTIIIYKWGSLLWEMLFWDHHSIVGMRLFWRLRWETASSPLQFLSNSLASRTNTYWNCKKYLVELPQILIVSTTNHEEN